MVCCRLERKIPNKREQGGRNKILVCCVGFIIPDNLISKDVYLWSFVDMGLWNRGHTGDEELSDQSVVMGRDSIIIKLTDNFMETFRFSTVSRVEYDIQWSILEIIPVEVVMRVPLKW